MDSGETGISRKVLHYTRKCVYKYRNIRWRRFQLVGHLMRMKGERVPKEALKEYVEGKDQMGGRRRRCLHTVDRDTKWTLKYMNWRSSAEYGDVWRRRTEEAKAQVELQGH